MCVCACWWLSRVFSKARRKKDDKIDGRELKTKDKKLPVDQQMPHAVMGQTRTQSGDGRREGCCPSQRCDSPER